MSQKESFSYQINCFSKYYKVVVPDLVGFNGIKMTYPYTLSDYARDISALIGSLDDDVDVIAHSFGARVLFKLLPCERVGKIVLTGAAGLRPRPSFKRFSSVARYKLRKKLGLGTSKFGSPDYRATGGVMRSSLVNVLNERLEKRIRAVKNQCLIVWGEKDTETPLYMAKRLKAMIKNSSLITIGGAGHFAFLDRPDQFNLIVKEFLL